MRPGPDQRALFLPPRPAGGSERADPTPDTQAELFSCHGKMAPPRRRCNVTKRNCRQLSTISAARARSTDTSLETPRSIMVTPNSRSMRAMVSR